MRICVMSFFITGLLKNSWAGKMAQQVKVLATKPDDLSLILGTGLLKEFP